jgi:hypothetical protein
VGDGHACDSHRPGNANGGVLSEDQIKAWISTRTAHAKKHGRGPVRDRIDFLKRPQLLAELETKLGSAAAVWAKFGVRTKSALNKVGVGALKTALRGP